VAEPISYVDTSALLKWYVSEPGSDAVAAWIEEQPSLVFSRIGWLEFRCAVNRRRRARDLDDATADDVLGRFLADVAVGAFTLLPLNDEQALAANDLIARLAAPLRTLDALHLAAAIAHGADSIATADHDLALGAREMGLKVSLFGRSQ
jgi:predicted nucleic acid-binding protein